MTQTHNVYCDESCYLENDHQKVMVLGAVWCPFDRVETISNQVRSIKRDYGLSQNFEIKWTKVSPAKIKFYLSLLDYFFDNNDLHFRALVVPDKSVLRHDDFQQTHDDWYFKMYFDMLKIILNPNDRYRIYVDIKDTRGAAKVRKLAEVLSNNMYDFSREVIERIQLIRSHESQVLQLADLLIGIIATANRPNPTSDAKAALIELMRRRSGYSLVRTTLYLESKVNLFRWAAKAK